ncbi:MAG: hypothetical protein FWG40_04835 [Peptococcaceae bacterium]|nr:hypothetical protein [Peptococcaceae bacterium]
MHTVIITDQHTTALFATHRRLFAPFLPERGGSVCQCSWHEAGTDIEQAVPELYKSIKGYPEWRAIIFVNSVGDGMADNSLAGDSLADNSLALYSPHNPFDFVCNHSFDLLIQENPIPLVRLTHMLAGFPSLGVKDYATGYTYYDEQTGAFLDCLHEDGTPILESDVGTLAPEDYEKVFERFGGHIKLRLFEVPYSEKEKTEYRRLTRKYALKENRPVEILVLSTREILATDDREATRQAVNHAWNFHDEKDSSGFWKIYPNTCRFLCYDLINREHTLYPRELWRLCLLTLTLAINQIPSQALQAYHLYRADLSIKSGELARVLENHRANLLSIQGILQEQKQRASQVTTDRKDLVPMQEVSVRFEPLDDETIVADTTMLGLASDCPIPEIRFWREHKQEANRKIEHLLSGLRELVAAKAIETRNRISGFAGKEQTLDRFQIERIQRRLDELEPRIINARIYGLLDPNVYMAEIDAAGQTVRQSLGLRLTKRNILYISLFALIIFLGGFVPYLINAWDMSRNVFWASLGLTGSALGLLAVGGLLILWAVRRKLLKKIKTYNETVIAVFDQANAGAQVYGDYFSKVCTYMYARSLLMGSRLKQDSDTAAEKLRKAHMAALEDEIALSRLLCSLHGIPTDTPALNNPFISIPDRFLQEHPSASPLYELVPNTDSKTLKLDNTGEPLDAPYSFISGLCLIREEIYEKKGV